MAVALRLMDEFEGQSLTVLRVVAEAADPYPDCEPSLVEAAARARLVALTCARCTPDARQCEHDDERVVPVPPQRAVG
jgi:hypothetical protein